MSRRPNILFVMADQMAPGFLPIHGHPVVKAPHLEALADRGTVFDQPAARATAVTREGSRCARDTG